MNKFIENLDLSAPGAKADCCSFFIVVMDIDSEGRHPLADGLSSTPNRKMGIACNTINWGNSFRGIQMAQHEHIQLASSEIGNLWTTYINDSMFVCIFRYSVNIIKDEQIKSIHELALQYSQEHLQQIKAFFKSENHPIPHGFVEEDVNTDAPRLYSDEFLLFFLNTMSIHGMTSYSLAISTSVRSDIRRFFIKAHAQATELYEQCMDLLLSKGLYIRPPQVPVPNEIEFAQSLSYVTPDWLGKHRPLNVIEITNIFFNLKKSIMTKALAISFSQTANDKEIRNYMAKVVELTQKHIEQFTAVLHDDYLNSTTLWDSHITESRVPVFSDKLLMFLGSFLLSAAMGYYGTGRSTSMRMDLVTLYSAAILGDEKMAAQGMKIMIKNGWLEESPNAANRKELIKK